MHAPHEDHKHKTNSTIETVVKEEPLGSDVALEPSKDKDTEINE